MVSLFSMDNWFLAMDFIFYAVENGLNKFSEPKMNGKMSVNECLEILIIIIVIKYRPCIQLHLCTQW